MGAAIFFSCKYIRGMFWSSAGKREIVTKQRKHINFLLTLSKEGSLLCYTGCDTLGLCFLDGGFIATRLLLLLFLT